MQATNYDPIVTEVHAEMVTLRTRGMYRTDSRRLSEAIKTIARRRGRTYEQVEAALEPAMQFRVAF